VKKILIVDDLEEIRDLVERTLRRKDRTVLTATTGEEAVAVARSALPDLIMMDVMMPGSMDGIDATRILKSDPETRKCVIIILTAKDQAQDRDEGLAAGADDFFCKPFSPLEILRKVDEVLDR
jgi:two-component system, OmpR family, phosphate regulon response regulator PhoB